MFRHAPKHATMKHFTVTNHIELSATSGSILAKESVLCVDRLPIAHSLVMYTCTSGQVDAAACGRPELIILLFFPIILLEFLNF